MPRNEPTVSVHSHISVITLAKAFYAFPEAGQYGEWASLVRFCVETAAANADYNPTVSEAMSFLEASGFSFKQLRLRGVGIRQAVQREENAPVLVQSQSDRASEISDVLDGGRADESS